MASIPTFTPSNRRQQGIMFLASIGLLLVAGTSVIELLATAWGQRPWSLARHLLRGGMNAVGVDPTVFYYIPLGVFVGLVVGLLLDSFKYVQGLIVVGATLLAVPLVFIPRGVFVEPLALSFGPETVLTALLFAVATLRVGGITLDRLDSDQREFPRIPKLILWVTIVFAAFGLFEAHFLYDSPIVVAPDGGLATQPFAFQGVVGAGAATHIAGVAVLLPALRYFTAYERGMNVIMLGPKRSGKSAVFGGIHLYIRDNVDGSSAAATRVNKLRQSIESTRFPDPTPATFQSGGGGSDGAQPMLLELPYSWGKFVPTRVRFSVVEYPGEALEDILAEVSRKATQQLQGGDATMATDGGERDSFEVPFSDDDGDDNKDEDDPAQWGADVGGADSTGAAGADGTVGRSGPSGTDGIGPEHDGAGSGPDGPEGPFGSEIGRGSAGAGDSEVDPFEDGAAEDAPIDENPKSSWEAATRIIRAANNLSEMIPGIRGCIHNADRIILTLPLDDFVAPVIERGNAPEYLQDRVIRPEEINDYRRSEIQPIEYNGRTYGVKGPNRDDVSDYLEWYESVQAIYPDKDIVIVGTMADWMLEDFRANRESAVAPQSDEGYREFCEYVRDEIVRAQTPAVNQVFGGRQDPDPLFLLWYDIDNEEPAGTDELRIDVSRPPVLKGARQFMRRINQ